MAKIQTKQPAPVTSAPAPAEQPKSTAVAVMSNEVPAFLQGKVGADVKGRGSEGVGADDLVIPRLEIIQDLSPARKKQDPAYIEGAEEGMMYNNVTRRLYSETVLLVPVFFRKEWLIWKDRNAGGGFRGAFPTEQAAQHEIAHGDHDDAKDLEAIDTPQHFCLLVDPIKGTCEEIVVSMSRSKAKVSRTWNSLIRMNGGDSFSRLYRMGVVAAKNAKNQDFFNFDIKNGGFVNEVIYKKAEELYSAIKSGKADVDRSFDEADPSAEGPGKSEY